MSPSGRGSSCSELDCVERAAQECPYGDDDKLILDCLCVARCAEGGIRETNKYPLVSRDCQKACKGALLSTFPTKWVWES